MTLSGVDDAANQGMDPTMAVIVHNSVGGNICVTATQTGRRRVHVYDYVGRAVPDDANRIRHVDLQSAIAAVRAGGGLSGLRHVRSR